MDKYDVLIIGGGTSGATAAFILQNAGLNCLIADDTSQYRSFKIGESLLNAAKPILEKAGLMPWVLQSSPQVNYGNISAWGNAQLSSRDFIFSPYGAGWHLDRALFDQSLRNAAKHAGASFHDGYIKKVIRHDKNWISEAKDKAFKSTWVIDASGRSALMAKQLGITRYKDCPLVAFYSVSNNTANETRTLVETAPYGWWYTASIPRQRRVAALHIRPKDIKSVLKDKSSWKNLISATQHVSQLCLSDNNFDWQPLQGTDAAGQWQQVVSGKNWVAIGDAALAFDPISSQGIFNAIYTAWRASKSIKEYYFKNENNFEFYNNEIHSVRNFYKKNEELYYAMEKRWPLENFWKIT